MKNLFKHASSSWVRYSKYEWKKKPGTFTGLVWRHSRASLLNIILS